MEGTHPNASQCWHAYVWFYPRTTRDWAFVMFQLLFGNVVALAGLIGNTITIFALNKEKKSDGATLGLKALAISDNVVIIVYTADSIIDASFTRFGIMRPLYEAFTTIYPGYFYVMYVVKLVSFFITLLITVQRYMAVSRPLKAMDYGSVKRTTIGIIVCIIFSIFLCLPYAFVLEAFYIFDPCSNREVATWTRSDFGSNFYFQTVFHGTIFTIIFFIIPLLLLSVLNVLLISHVRKASENRRKMSMKDENEAAPDNTMTLRIIGIIGAFVACELPFKIVNIGQTILFNTSKSLEDYNNSPLRPILSETSHYLAQLSGVQHSINFYIYILIGDRFKNTVRKMIRCQTD